MKKIISKIMLVTMLVVAMIPLTAKAGYQANKGGKSLVSVTASNFFTGIKNMETGTLGKIKDEMDCHMAKNTEWGTAALLSASIYGIAPNGTNSTESTTGNSTGVYQMADIGREYVAGIYAGKASVLGSPDAKYYNEYTDSHVSIPGDGLEETQNWKDASSANWVTSSGPVFKRDYNDMFGFAFSNGTADSSCSSRAVIVFTSGHE